MNWIRVALLIVICLIIIWFIRSVYDSGTKSVINRINEQNTKALKDAEIANYSIDECLARRNSGERVFFDFDTGKCRRSPAGD